ncbi:hypothetical protein DEVEQU_01210 [Devosia equisanguinis]|uniref:Thiol:disulfide interchange protein DsbD N-terminal domain-containing protein n=1 Tax=Devosia equisanguinis TaxID=2490941 RepID=A0A3S4CAX4_9HYPH|nr:protein-disulfide reductase DsbD domain-containing protein [Devosia equisanguinis]VDS04079.1 hypothetical protein DEVEQU_01210 [Devosia equisanguinis]
MRTLLALLTVPFLALSPALAGETAWQELAPGVTLRLISTGIVKADGTTLMALEIDMPADTKTYWRVPGDTGLPTQIDFTGSIGVSGHEMHWPYPVRDQKADYLDYVYFGHVVLPFAVTVDDPAGRVEAAVTLGVCAEICIPAQARLSLDLRDAAPDRANGLRIRQALASVPARWAEADEPIGAVEVLDGGKAIGVWINDDGFDPASLIASTQEGFPVFGAPQKSPQTNLVTLPIHGKTDNSALQGKIVQLTFMTGMGAFEVSRTIGKPVDDVTAPRP